MDLVFATGNLHKLKEVQDILGDGFNVISSKDVGIVEDIEETGLTLKDNSLLKANYVYERCKRTCFADDTGLEVSMLHGQPGVYSARYAGEHASFEDNMMKLLKEMALKENEASMMRSLHIKTPYDTRQARFKTVITLIIDGEPKFFEGSVYGHISICEKGCKGFGYDPIFIPDYIPGQDGLVENVNKKSFAELSEEEKNIISHRGKAIRKMLDYLRALEDNEK